MAPIWTQTPSSRVHVSKKLVILSLCLVILVSLLFTMTTKCLRGFSRDSLIADCILSGSIGHFFSHHFLPSFLSSFLLNHVHQSISAKTAAEIMLLAGNSHGWESAAVKGIALALEKTFPQWTFPETRFFDPKFDQPDPFTPEHADEFLPHLTPSKVPFVNVLGDGNCLDNSTLHVLEKTISRSFEFRVRKGLHFVANFATYRKVLSASFIFEEEVAKHCRLYFRNYEYQSPEHDAPAAFMINRPIVHYYPGV